MSKVKYVAKIVGQDIYIKSGKNREETLDKKKAAIMSWEGIEKFVQSLNIEAVEKGINKRYEITYL